MKKYLLITLLCLVVRYAHSEIDSLYNSKWKGGMRLSVVDFPVTFEDGRLGYFLFGIPITRNIKHTSFNIESGIYAGGYIPFANPSQNYYDKKKGFNLGLPLKIKYDRDGMFLSSGIHNWFCHTRYEGFDFDHEPVAFTINSYFLKFNFTMGFEKYIGHDCEIFVDVFYDRTLAIASDQREFVYDVYWRGNLGLSLGILIRGN